MTTRKRKGWRDNWREARLIHAVEGKFSSWRAGERVRAVETGGGKFLIEKVGFKPLEPSAALPIQNQCAGVPADCIQFI